jgi:hypothetical protein
MACFHWLVGVGNGSSHLIARSSASFVRDTKMGWISKAAGRVTRDFPMGNCYHRFYTRSGGLRVGCLSLSYCIKCISQAFHMNIRSKKKSRIIAFYNITRILNFLFCCINNYVISSEI